jgi:protein-disulfide isomerase
MKIDLLCARALVVVGLMTLLAACGSDREPSESSATKEGPAPERYAVDAPVGAPSIGPQDAEVTVVCFSDFQTTTGAKNAHSLRKIAEKFGDAVRIVYRANPLPKHQDAQRAEEAARAAHRQGKFWGFHDALFEHSEIREADLFAAAKKAGCDLERLRKDMDDPRLMEQAASDRQAALEMGIDNAPFNFINGRPLRSIRFPEDIYSLVNDEIRRARSLTAGGKAKKDVYETLIASAKKHLPRTRNPQRRLLDPNTRYRIPVSRDDPAIGPSDAPLTVVVFMDFQSPFCARNYPAIVRLPGELAPNVRVVIKHFPQPSHPSADIAAQVSLEAQAQGLFWEYCKAIFENWDGLDKKKLLQAARTVKMDMGALEAALADGRHSVRIERDRKLANSLDLKGTPYFFFNGIMLRGSRSFDQLVALSLPRIRSASQLLPLDGGPSDLYAKIIEKGATEPVYQEPGSALYDPEIVSDGKHRVYDLDLPDDTPMLGSSDAPVTVVEFGDYQCGACARASALLERIRERYRDRVRIAYVHYPLPGHEHAFVAAQAAVEAARQGRFWDFHEVLMDNQENLSLENLITLAGNNGLDADKMRTALDQELHANSVRENRKLARVLKLAGTPSFFVNGRKVGASRMETELTNLVEDMLALHGDKN